MNNIATCAVKPNHYTIWLTLIIIQQYSLNAGINREIMRYFPVIYSYTYCVNECEVLCITPH